MTGRTPVRLVRTPVSDEHFRTKLSILNFKVIGQERNHKNFLENVEKCWFKQIAEFLLDSEGLANVLKIKEQEVQISRFATAFDFHSDLS